jgi:hypothetical protein
LPARRTGKAQSEVNLVSNLQHNAKRKRILLAGESGTGKTTFGLRYLVSNTDLTCRFLFDAEGEFADRLNLTPATTEEECNLAAEDGFVVFDPDGEFAGEHEKAFAWFCSWVFAKSSSMPGEKILFVDEVWMYCSPNAIPKPLAVCIQTGRKRGLATMFATQRPNRLNEAITNGVTECVVFRLQGDNALKTLAGIGVDVDEIPSLPDGAFLSVDLKTGKEERGRLW